MSKARELDQFYTDGHVAKYCFDILLQHVELSPDDWLLEPSAGDGAFLMVMRQRWAADRCIGIDIDPGCESVTRCEFLEEFSPNPAAKRWITTGNPPFGKNCSLAVRFVKRAAEFSEVIAFIVPLTFRKASLQKRLPMNLELVADVELPRRSFVFEGAPYSVPCCFQIWRRCDEPRVHVDAPLTHDDFSFVGPAQADIAVRRIGAHAGKVLVEFDGYSPNSHFFMKSRKVGRSELIRRLSSIDWSDVKFHTAGNPSISKRELVAKYSAVSRLVQSADFVHHPRGASGCASVA